MGGQSVSSFTVSTNHTGVFSGTNKIVPSLKAPGFCNAQGRFEHEIDLSAFGYNPDGSSKSAFQIVGRTTTPQYQGYRMAFGGRGIPKTSIFGGGSFKASFNVTGTEFHTITVPLGDFSYDWSGFTGSCTTKDPERGGFKQ